MKELNKPDSFVGLLESNDERLRQTSKPIAPEEIEQPETQQIVDTLLQIAAGERDAGPGSAYMVGLAAPQLGIFKRIIAADMSIRHGLVPGVDAPVQQLTAYINPEIVNHSEDTYEFREGCFSYFAKDGVYAKVPRYKSIKVRAYTRHGELVEFASEGYSARILQHEIDHLDGVRYADRLPEGRMLQRVLPEQMEEYRDGGWENWPHEISPDQLA